MDLSLGKGASCNVAGDGPIPFDEFIHIDVPSDGNCFYHAVVHQLKLLGLPAHHMMLRQMSVNMVRDNQDDFVDFIEDENPTSRMYQSGQ